MWMATTALLVKPRFGVTVSQVWSSVVRMASQQPGPGPVQAAIQQKLTDTFAPAHLEIINESFMHNVPRGSETHFKAKQ